MQPPLPQAAELLKLHSTQSALRTRTLAQIGARLPDADHVHEHSNLGPMAALTNALQALSARAKETVMRRPNAVKALHNAVRDAVEQHASALTEQGPQIDALLTAMSAVDEAYCLCKEELCKLHCSPVLLRSVIQLCVSAPRELCELIGRFHQE